MRRIDKGREPNSLIAHRKGGGATYENFQAKQELRDALVAEQGGLCCYCMDRIEADAASMKIEHWRCRSRFRNLELTYGNLLGACRGGEGQLRSKQHCDTRKGDRDLDRNPADPSHHIETRVCYLDDGTIYSSEDTFDRQLNDVLNLNLEVLKAHRKSVLDSMLEWWKKERAQFRGPVRAEWLHRKREKHVGRVGELTPFCQVKAWWFDRKLDRLASR